MLKWFRKRDLPVSKGDERLYQMVLDEMESVRAYARSHGGEIELVSVSEEGDVVIRFKGACHGCPISGITLRVGIEERLRSKIPEVRRVTSEL